MQPGIGEQGVVADIEVRRPAAEPALRRKHRHAPVRTQIAHGVVRIAEATRLVGIWVVVEIDEVELVASIDQRLILRRGLLDQLPVCLGDRRVLRIVGHLVVCVGNATRTVDVYICVLGLPLEVDPSGSGIALGDGDDDRVGAVEPSDDRRSCKRRKRSSRRLFHSVARRSSSSGSEGRPPVSGIEPLVDGLDTGTKISDPSEKIGSDGLNLIQVTFAIGILAPIVFCYSALGAE